MSAEIHIGTQLLKPVPPSPAGSHRGGDGNRKSAAGVKGTAVRGVRRLLGMVFQDFQLFPHLTALQNVIEAPIHVLRLNRAAAIERGLDDMKEGRFATDEQVSAAFRRRG